MRFESHDLPGHTGKCLPTQFHSHSYDLQLVHTSWLAAQDLRRSDSGGSARFRQWMARCLVNSSCTMRPDLQAVLSTLRDHESDLRRLGVLHAGVFGSVARGEAGGESDIDVLVDLDENRPMGVFEYARLKLYIDDLLYSASDVVNRRTLKPFLRSGILRDTINAF